MWNAAYFGTTSQRMVAEYVVPFDNPTIIVGEARPAGAVFVNFTLDQVSQSVSWLSLGARGYGLVAAQDPCGTYVAHPNRDYFSDPAVIAVRGQQKTLFAGDGCNVANERETDALEFIQNRRDESGYVDYRDEITGRDAWLFHEPVPSTQWILGSVVIKSEALARDSTAHHLLMAVGAATLLSLFAIFALALRVFREDGWFSWNVAILFSVLCVLGVAYVWALVRTTPEVEAGLGGEGQDLAEIVDDYRERVRVDKQSGDLREVAVGVSLDSVNELDNGDLVFSGIAWQRFLAEADDETVPGFVLSPDIADTRLEERFDIRNGRERIIGWSFSATLRAPLTSPNSPSIAAKFASRSNHETSGRPPSSFPTYRHIRSACRSRGRDWGRTSNSPAGAPNGVSSPTARTLTTRRASGARIPRSEPRNLSCRSRCASLASPSTRSCPACFPSLLFRSWCFPSFSSSSALALIPKTSQSLQESPRFRSSAPCCSCSSLATTAPPTLIYLEFFYIIMYAIIG